MHPTLHETSFSVHILILISLIFENEQHLPFLGISILYVPRIQNVMAG